MSKTERIRFSIKKYMILSLVIALAIAMGSYWLGWEMLLWLTGFILFLIAFMPKSSMRIILRMNNAKRITPINAPLIFEMVSQLSSRAGLPKLPEIFLLPQKSLNAFATGSSRAPVIGITHGLVNFLNERELYGVLAHEISHIKNKDISLKTFAGVVGGITHNLSFIGRILLFINLPLYLMGYEIIPWLAVLMLIFAPALNSLLQMGLSRSMEYMADADAVQLTGDPMGLASALKKIDAFTKRQWYNISYQIPKNSWLCSHPAVEDRINLLLKNYTLKKDNPLALLRNLSWI